MNKTTGNGRLMDAATIVEELGVTKATADHIIRWCATRGGVVRPDGIRKKYVYRADVTAWLAESTVRAA